MKTLFLPVCCGCLCAALLCNSILPAAYAQSPQAVTDTAERFSGAWGNKKARRHLRIFKEAESYVTINDWTGTRKDQQHADAYKAWPKNGKLVMPEDTEHHAPYSELLLRHDTLVYATVYKDAEGRPVTEEQYFFREAW